MAAYNVASSNDPEQIRNKLRPDAMIVEMTAEFEQYMQHPTMAQLFAQMPNSKPRKVWVAEAGCCSDTMYLHNGAATQASARSFVSIWI